MADDNLDALCDLLNDSDDDDIFNLVEEQVANIENNQNGEDQSSPNQDPNVAEMEAKMQRMQEEMAKMQKELEAAKKQPSKKLSEIDVFQPSGSRSVQNAPRCPNKSNPFAEQDRPKNPAKYHPETPEFGPALAKKTSRVLSGDEKLKFEHELKKRQEQREMGEIAARDLADSSDEDEVSKLKTVKINTYF